MIYTYQQTWPHWRFPSVESNPAPILRSSHITQVIKYRICNPEIDGPVDNLSPFLSLYLISSLICIQQVFSQHIQTM